MPIISIDDYYTSRANLDSAIAEADSQRQQAQEARAYTASAQQQWTASMPHHPAEENTEGNLTDMVAKESSDSTASDHPRHSVQQGGATSGGMGGKGMASAEDHKAAPGPVMSENVGKPMGKEELKARAEELNK